MKKGEFVKFAVKHSDKGTLENLICKLVDEMPIVKEELFNIFSDEEVGLIIKNNGQLFLHPNFLNGNGHNGKEKLNEVSGTKNDNKTLSVFSR